MQFAARISHVQPLVWKADDTGKIVVDGGGKIVNNDGVVVVVVGSTGSYG